ncbi:MAG: MBL fold metallo-hydrolase [Candidatus Thorarchaeota archaeon]|jgi:ribonuclease BN (tRNA processing enzyme)
MESKVILLGTGTPNIDPDRSGPSVAIVIGDSTYIIDFGPGVVRRAMAAGIKPKSMTRAFLTHLHSDHTIGYPDLILSPAVEGRLDSLEVYGPKGLVEMTNLIQKAYMIDMRERIEGLEPANEEGYVVNAHEIREGIIYKDDNLEVEAFRVDHGALDAFGFKFVTPDKRIVISGDTRPSLNLIEKSMDCDILIHEVYSSVGLNERSEDWIKYHTSVHTSTIELAEIANKVKPGILVLYHQLFWKRTEEELLKEITERYGGRVVSGKDLDVF